MKSFAVAVASALLMVASPVVPAQQNRSPVIAVAAEGNTPSARVGNQLGRSAFFLLFDAQGAFVGAEVNPYKGAGNAGIPAVDLLADKGAKVIVAESFGPRIVDVMTSKGLRPLEFKGSAENAARKALELK
jgi:predicted Fe-Mo cluster-binding NifX family protein